ncbi:hypothetical protein H2248_001494 [Termitomyces sp. 'cryptogamus']|nr:hypothetical protein H2248_001494 [Termitomyces sp. 'cryptogamus']
MAIEDYTPPAQDTLTPIPAPAPTPAPLPTASPVLAPAPITTLINVTQTSAPLMLAHLAPDNVGLDDLLNGLDDFFNDDLDTPGELEEETVALSKSKEIQKVQQGCGKKKAIYWSIYDI